jgi:hypothetical protein
MLIDKVLHVLLRMALYLSLEGNSDSFTAKHFKHSTVRLQARTSLTYTVLSSHLTADVLTT